MTYLPHLLLFILLLLGFAEYLTLQNKLKRIKIRIHVNGTRGKSTVTRLIAAGLKAGGYKVLAKTTGTLPVVIFDDGTEIMMQRRGRATIREQARALRLAAQRNVDAVVLECMAIHPELQSVSERRMIQSTIGVITNVRNDHAEVLGKIGYGVAEGLSGTIPRNGLLVSADSEYFNYFREKAEAVGSKAILVSANAGDEKPSSTDVCLFRENLEMALAVCDQLGVDRAKALSEMLSMRQDIGAAKIQELHIEAKPCKFINAFSVNDTESFLILWDRLVKRRLAPSPVIAILNCREDRQLRSESFGWMVGGDLRPEKLLLVGGGVKFAGLAAMKAGYGKERILAGGRATEAAFFSLLARHVTNGSTIVGLGNYHGWGAKIVTWLDRYSENVP